MNIEQLIAELTLDEGVRLKAYSCTAGKRTIGIGRNYQDVPFTSAENMELFGATSISFLQADKILTTRGITMEQASMLLRNDINKCILQLQKYSFWSAVKNDDPKARAIINLCFNMGINTLLTFKNTLAYIEKQDWKNAARNLTMSKWYNQVKSRGPRVVKLIDPTFYDEPVKVEVKEVAKPVVKEVKPVVKATKSNRK